MKIIQVKTKGQVNEIRKLFLEYEKYLNVDLCFQDFEQELAKLPGNYSSPEGALLLACDKEQIAGCVALRKWKKDICEMKRLYVRKKFRGEGLGRRLAVRIILEAQKRRYSRMRLDTLDKLKEAIQLYESLGFRNISKYYNNPLPGVIYWELDLKRDIESTGTIY